MPNHKCISELMTRTQNSSRPNAKTDRDSLTEHLSHTHQDGSIHGHVHSEESLKALLNRLSRVEGHVRGIKVMVQEGRPCPDVLIQIAAVRGALDRIARLILDEHLSECITRAAQAGTIETELQELKAALDRFLG